MASTEDFESSGSGSNPGSSANLDKQLSDWEKRMEKRKEEERKEEEEEAKKRAEANRKSYIRRRGGSDPELGRTGDHLRQQHRAMVDPANRHLKGR